MEKGSVASESETVLIQPLRMTTGHLSVIANADTPEQTLRTATAIAAMAVTQIGFGINDAAQLAQLEQGVRVRPLTEQ